MAGMLKYAVKKIFLGIPAILGVSIILFSIMHMIPGDPIVLIVGERVDPSRIEELREAWGLNKPIYIQYFYWLSHFIQGDFGTSIIHRQPVSDLIFSRLPFTIELTLTSLIIAYIIGIPIGVVAALKRGSWIDYLAMGFAIFFYSMPGFWLGLMLMLLFGLYLKWLPLSGYGGPESLILPALTLALPSIAMIARLIRSEMLEVLTEDYVRTAWAKGLPSRTVIFRHAFKNALIPVIVMFFLQLPWLIGGAVVIETVFAWPGMGRLLYKSIVRQDYPVVQAIILIIAILTVISNILGDIVSAILDPRIRLEEAG